MIYSSRFACRVIVDHAQCSTKRLVHHISGAGLGTGNVMDKMLPSVVDSNIVYKHTKRPKTISVIGAPMTYGQPYFGTDEGPSLMRSNGLLQSLTSLGWRVNDTGDLDFEKLAEESTHTFDDTHELEKAKNSDIVGRGCKMIADVVSEELTHSRFPLILGGDHSIGIGSLAGILSVRPNTGVIWVDAHADINTPEMSESGNMHGMPIAFVMEGMMKNPHQIRGFEWLKARNARLSPESLVYIGLRDVDAAERDVMKKMGIKAFTMHEIDRYGIGTVMDLAFSHLFHNNADRPIHVSYDVDAVDPIFAPATGTTVRGGLTFREAHYVAESIARCGNLASAEIVEVNPTLSDGKGGMETLDLSLGLVTSLLGKSII